MRSTLGGERLEEVPPLRVHSLTEGSWANGPGPRTVLHVQGCALACKGCFSPHTWRKDLGTGVDVLTMVSDIGDTDLTISGGEPLDQLPAITTLILLRRVMYQQRTTLMYTGYNVDELEAGSPSRLGALRIAGLDGLVYGRYDASVPQVGVPLRSSANQVYLDLTGRVPEGSLNGPEVEVLVGPDGVATMTGFPTRALVQGFRREMEG